GGQSADHIIGSALANVLDGNGGDDTIEGLAGDDTIDGGAGTDTMLGGDGLDTVDYTSHTDDVTITLDGLANDGATGENDFVNDEFENAQGGFGDDSITGDVPVVLNQIDPLTGLEVLDPLTNLPIPVIDPLTGLPVLVGGTN